LRKRISRNLVMLLVPPLEHGLAICSHIHDQCSPSAQVSRYDLVYLRGAWAALWVYIQTRLAHARSLQKECA